MAGIVGAIGGGMLAERFGPKRVIQGTLVIAIGALLAEAITGSGELLWVVGPLLGVVLGSLSAVDRVFLLRLIPPERRGEDFGLYALVGKLSTGFGPLVLWGGTILVATRARRACRSSTPAAWRSSCSRARRSLGWLDPAPAVGQGAVRGRPGGAGHVALQQADAVEVHDVGGVVGVVSGSDAERVLAERSEAGVERRAVRLGAGA